MEMESTLVIIYMACGFLVCWSEQKTFEQPSMEQCEIAKEAARPLYKTNAKLACVPGRFTP